MFGIESPQLTDIYTHDFQKCPPRAWSAHFPLIRKKKNQDIPIKTAAKLLTSKEKHSLAARQAHLHPRMCVLVLFARFRYKSWKRLQHSFPLPKNLCQAADVYKPARTQSWWVKKRPPRRGEKSTKWVNHRSKYSPPFPILSRITKYSAECSVYNGYTLCSIYRYQTRCVILYGLRSRVGYSYILAVHLTVHGRLQKRIWSRRVCSKSQRSRTRLTSCAAYIYCDRCVLPLYIHVVYSRPVYHRISFILCLDIWTESLGALSSLMWALKSISHTRGFRISLSNNAESWSTRILNCVR